MHSDPRVIEELLVALCAKASTGDVAAATNEMEAHVLQLAARILAGPRELCDAMERAALVYFTNHGAAEPVSPDEMVDRGWILGLPRFRQALATAMENAR